MHGLSQVRDRTFYFFWKGDEVPLFEYVLEKPSMIADDIRAVERRDDDPMSQILCNDKTPSEEPYYKYVLEVLKANAREILFIDDLGINLKPAKELGFHTYKFTDTDKTISYIKNMLHL